LRGFDFSLLADQITIGCNSAFKLGPDVCKIVFFSDIEWFNENKDLLKEFEGDVFTHCHALVNFSYKNTWLKTMRREKRGLHTHALGMNGNSGCGAVNLALIMGAKRVFLLGCDCKVTGNKETHWHDYYTRPANLDVFPKFLAGWNEVHNALPKVFPGTEIINLGPDSDIPFFRKADYKEYLSHAENHA